MLGWGGKASNAIRLASCTLLLASACGDVGGMRDGDNSCDARDAQCGASEGGRPNAGRGGAGAGDGGATPGGGSGATDAGPRPLDGGDAAPTSEAGTDGGMDGAAPGDGGDPGADGATDGGVDCAALEAACVSDDDFERSQTPSSHACGFTCAQTRRACSLFESDTYCPQACSYDDLDCAPANRLFLTKTAYDGNMDGSPDAKCYESAAAAGLEGTFVALLGYSSISAHARLVNARGFVRLDGEPIADDQAALVSGSVFTAPIINEEGQPMPPDTVVATAIGGAGSATDTCTDWSATFGGTTTFGVAGDGGGRWRDAGFGGCNDRLHLYCTEVLQQVEVKPRAAPNTRTAFVAPGFDPSTGIAGADAACMAAAVAAKLDGTFKALLATSSQAPIARFDLTGGAPWARVDGTRIVKAGADLASGRLAAPLNQGADGTYYNEGIAWTGTNDPRRTALESCKNWSTRAAPFAAHAGQIAATGPRFLSNDLPSLPCAIEDAFVYCLEEAGDGSAPAPPSGSEANVVFVTDQTWSGNLGGLAGADAKCQAAATGAGLDGTFIAVLSTATVSAQQRLAGARGFVRTTGEPVAETPLDLVRGRFLYPPGMLSGGAIPAVPRVWTGARGDCRGFTSSSIDATGTRGWAGSDGPGAFDHGYVTCDLMAHLYCAETARDSAITRPSTAGKRLAFVARGDPVAIAQLFTVDPGVGLAGLDALCVQEAQAFGLSGDFGAFVATSTASAASRFSGTGAAWARVDGPLLAPTAAAFLSDGQSVSLDVAADGFEHFGRQSNVWFGAMDAGRVGDMTCSDWTSNGSGTAWTARAGTIGAFSAGERAPCNATYAHLFCLQF